MSGWAGLWMRVDATSSRTDAFGNMMDRPIMAGIGWARYQVVVDVGSESERVAFGVLLSGAGQVRANSTGRCTGHDGREKPSHHGGGLVAGDIELVGG